MLGMSSNSGSSSSSSSGMHGGAYANTSDMEAYENALTSFRNYLANESSTNNFADRISAINETKRLLVDIDHLRESYGNIVNDLLQRPVVFIRAFEEALNAFMNESGLASSSNHSSLGGYNDSDSFSKKTLDSSAAGGNSKITAMGKAPPKYKVGFVGQFGTHLVSPRTLQSSYVCKLVCVEGIVTKVSIVKPKLERSVHYCPKTKQSLVREYRDATSFEGLPTTTTVPTRDENDNLLELEFGLSTYSDSQRITMQEMPEKAPLGQLPRSVDILVADDLVDKVKPGDRVRISGVFRAIGSGMAGGFSSGTGNGKSTSGIFQTVVIASSIQVIGKEYKGLYMTPSDIENIRSIALSNGKSIFDKLARSLAPSIFGHDYIKKAILLMLVGGIEKNLENGTHLRGDINILLVGDPSTAKSQMLRFILSIAPLAVSTTGRGSTGVGLTAAVTTDEETGERRLEAGAMVLADRGVVCIDEFDKMSDADRVAIHEVMEQQTVTITKGGIHASLNARCSVCAAANPIYGQYDRNLSAQKNIGLPDSLLSRFDLLFIVLDNTNPTSDAAIANHVLRMHRYQIPGREGIPVPISSSRGILSSMSLLDSKNDREDMAAASAPIYQAYNPLLHSAFSSTTSQTEIFSTQFIKKYIHYVKMRFRPVLSEEAAKILSQDWAKLRQDGAKKTLPVTPRQLETMIRLATAHAKLRLSNIVEEIDCEAAKEVMRFALYNDTGKNQKQFDMANDQENEMETGNKKRSVDAEETKLRDEMEEENNISPSLKKSKVHHVPTEVDEESERFQRFQKVIGNLFRSNQNDDLDVGQVIAEANKQLIADQDELSSKDEGEYSKEEAELYFRHLESQNKIMYRDDVIISI